MRFAILMICFAWVVSAERCSIPNFPFLGADGSPREAESSDEYKFLVTVECQPHNLKISWKLTSDAEDEYAASVNYACVNSDGRYVHLSEGNQFITDGERQGVIDTNSVPVQELMNNGGTCIVYGCHHNQIDRRPFLFNQNVSCSYNPPVMISWTIDSTSWVTPDHTEDSIMPSSSISLTDTPQEITRSLPISVMESTSTHTMMYTQVTATPSPTVAIVNKGVERSTTIMISITILVTVLIITAIILTAVVISAFKKKTMKDPRFRNLGSTLNVEKIDPYYTPIQVESSIRKCESMGSIFEYLSVHRDNHSDESNKLFTLSVINSHQQSLDPSHNLDFQTEVAYNSPYVLQPPHSTYNNVRTSSVSSSDYHSSTTSLSTLPQCDTPLHVMATKQDLDKVDELGVVYKQTKQTTAGFSNILFKQKHCGSTYSSSEDNESTTKIPSVVCCKGGYIHVEPHDIDVMLAKSKDINNDTEDFLNDSNNEDSDYINAEDTLDQDNNYNAEDLSDNRIILTFSSSLNSCSDVILVEESNSSPDSDKKTHLAEESITEFNLTINPHHFDPL